MIRLWGRTTSINVQKVMWTLAELGLSYERIDAGGAFGKLDTQEFAELNPNRLVPVLEDDGFALWESSSIVRYLAQKYGRGSIVGEDLHLIALADQWMEWAGTSLYADIITTCFWGLVRTPKSQRNDVAIGEAASRVGDKLKVLDRHLTDKAYVLGEDFSIADIPAGALMYRYFHLDIARPDLPNIEAWVRRLRTRESYRSAIEVDYSSLQVQD